MRDLTTEKTSLKEALTKTQEKVKDLIDKIKLDDLFSNKTCMHKMYKKLLNNYLIHVEKDENNILNKDIKKYIILEDTHQTHEDFSESFKRGLAEVKEKILDQANGMNLETLEEVSQPLKYALDKEET